MLKQICHFRRRFMKKIIAITMLLNLFIVINSAIVTTKKGPYRVGERIGFNKDCHETDTAARGTCIWFWPDGTSTTQPDDLNHGWQYFTFKQTGMQTILYRRPNAMTIPICGGGSGYDETIEVSVLPAINKTISVSPAIPTAGQPAQFTAANFQTPNSIRWNMGDGTIYHKPMSVSRKSDSPLAASSITHTYATAGSYTVRAYDYNGDDSTPATLVVTVNYPNRSISYTPAKPKAGQPVQFIAINFLSAAIDWTFGDGQIISGGAASITHTYANRGTYTVTARESKTTNEKVTIYITVTDPDRRISYHPQNPRVDQLVSFTASGFLTSAIDWNFGDGTISQNGNVSQSHRYQNPGNYIVSAKDSSINHTPISVSIAVGAENRFIQVNPQEIRVGNPVTVTAHNFRGDVILWNFGDGTVQSGGHTITYIYQKSYRFIISARDENGLSQKEFQTPITVRGINDLINIELAEIKLDNNKYYKVVPKNSKNISAVLRLKMRGTGIVSGIWLADGHPFESFSEVAVQGQIKEIRTKPLPGLPTLQQGLHTITLQLTRPNDSNLNFPILKYYVMSFEDKIETLSPLDGFVAKEEDIPQFSWKSTPQASAYKIVFSSDLYSLLENAEALPWISVKNQLMMQPQPEIWQTIKRNRWIYWKVIAVDTFNQIVAESEIKEFKVVIANAKLSIRQITDLAGNPVLAAQKRVKCKDAHVLVQGDIEYFGDSKFLVLRVFANHELVDQLLFRDVRKNEIRTFETTIPNTSSNTEVLFQVLKTSSPAVIIGLENLYLNRE
jgi:PKD repeat protein